MRVSGRSQREVALVLLGVTRLLERAQHQERKDPLLRLARNLLHQLLIHTRRHVHFFRQLHYGSAPPAAIMRPFVRARLHALDRQRAHAQRVTEAGRNGFKVVNLFGVGLFMDAVEAGNSAVFQVAGDCFVGCQHELLDQAVRPVAL